MITEDKGSQSNVVEEWTSFSLDNELFKKIPEELLISIKNESKDLKPIIYELFEVIAKQCFENFSFASQKIPMEKYLTFYQEVNRIKPNLSQKILTHDAQSSVYYIGDTHGSIEDTFLLIEFFFKIIQKDPKIKIIFIGDYVDRNPWDLENLTIIVAFSILYPNNIILLRGNHEDRTINTNYGFIDNILRWYYEKGEILYEEILKYFIHLPLAEITQMYNKNSSLGARVLAVHGGIPIDWKNFTQPIILSDIESILQCEHERSEEMDPFSVSMLWSDPDEVVQNIITDGETGRMRFGFPILQAFLQANKLDVVVRGHQKWNEGYRIFFAGRLYSLFSTSKYDDKKKFDAKILHLELGKPPKLIEIKKSALNDQFSLYES